MSAETSESSDQVESPAPIRLQHGRRLGRYILCYELASGGMAAVYLARAPGASGFEKLVALKLIHPHLAKEQRFVDMFLDEARIAARIDHPNVCGVFDFGETDGTYFLAMEYLAGETISRIARALMRSHAASDERTIAILAYIVQQVCEGLHAAHEMRDDDGELAQLVHRDVTPQNLFVGFDGSVRVVDFGVASATGRTHQTTTGTLKGKFAYMSPEQLHRAELDRRSDIFSMGVCLWEMLTLRRLFRRDNEYETLKAVAEGEIRPPSEVRPGLPRALDAIVLRALERDRAARYSTARELGKELGAFVASCGGASGADVAELMATLFPEGRQERRDLVERARSVDPEAPSTSKIVAAPGFRDSGNTMPTDLPSAIAPPPVRGRSKLLLPALLVAVASAFALPFVLKGPDEDSVPVSDLPEEATSVPEAPSIPVEATQVVIPPEEAPPEERPPEETLSVEASPMAVDMTPRMVSNMRPRMVDTPAPATGEGTLNVATPPGWADIVVDGRPAGRSPTGIRLGAGRHQVRLMPYGEGPAITRSVEITDGETARLVVRLPD